MRDRLITGSIILGKLIKALTSPGETVGVLLPNSTKTLSVILGLQLYGRVPGMLNYSIGSAGMTSACNTGKISIVLTSRKFIDMAHLGDEAARLAEHVRLVYLEDLAASLSPWDKLAGLIQAKTADYWYKSHFYDSDDAAVTLFTSGSEGAPKGVVLSHANVLANLQQVRRASISIRPMWC